MLYKGLKIGPVLYTLEGNSRKKWDKLKQDYGACRRARFRCRQHGYVFSLNFGIITPLPKQKEASHIKHFCPICLLNVSFKIFTKVMVNRMTGIVMKLINPSQTAFMLDRNIMEGMVMLHKTIHEIHRKNDEWGHT
jgi:hypothetical protein